MFLFYYFLSFVRLYKQHMIAIRIQFYKKNVFVHMKNISFYYVSWSLSLLKRINKNFVRRPQCIRIILCVPVQRQIPTDVRQRLIFVKTSRNFIIWFGFRTLNLNFVLLFVLSYADNRHRPAFKKHDSEFSEHWNV